MGKWPTLVTEYLDCPKASEARKHLVVSATSGLHLVTALRVAQPEHTFHSLDIYATVLLAVLAE